jgi:hypothetical protein
MTYRAESRRRNHWSEGMNKRKRVAWRKHRVKAQKLEAKRKALPRHLRQPARRPAASQTAAPSNQ